jgi:DNA-directed RNA polymerase specialized sigma24 family protein
LKRPRELIRRERAEQLAAVLAELETRDQLLLTLRYVDGHPPEKVARMLGYSSRFAVHRRLKLLIASLRRRLEERGFEP